MDDLVEFLRARLDEDEVKARAASAGPWRIHPAMFEADSFDVRTLPDETHSIGQAVAADHEGFGACDISNAEHIVYFSSDRVLREVEAKRRVLARHRECGDGWGYCGDGGHGFEGGCADLLDLAAPYSGHPDYREEWRP